MELSSAVGTQGNELYLDEDGKVLAIKGLVVPKPWRVVESTKFKGRFFFLNTNTRKTEWSLDFAVIQGTHTNIDPPSTALVAPPLMAATAAAVDDDDEVICTELKSVQTSLTSLNSDKETATKIQSQAAKLVQTLPELPNRSTAAPSSSCCLVSLGSSNVNPKPPSVPQPSSDGTPHLEVVAGLGQGGYATVVLVKPAGRRATSANDLFAMKVIDKSKHKRPKDKARVATELVVMRDIPPSRFLARCHSAFETAGNIFFVCDYIAGGDLYFHVNRCMKEGRLGFEEHECKVLLAEVTLGLVHLHAHGYIHRDLKIENVMLDASGHVKLIDFGLAVDINGASAQSMSPTGSLVSMTPELIKHKVGGRHTDWWAMGILMFELMTGRAPWSSLTDKKRIRHEIQMSCVAFPVQVGASEAAADFLASLLQRDFRLRLGTGRNSEVRKAPFFEGVDWHAIARGETAPAFECGPTTAAAHGTGGGDARALEAYTTSITPEVHMPRMQGSGLPRMPPKWFLGVSVVASPPPILPTIARVS